MKTEILTPAEKAAQLVVDFSKAVTVKENLLLTINELIKESRKVSDIMYSIYDDSPFDPQIIYWEKVMGYIKKHT